MSNPLPIFGIIVSSIPICVGKAIQGSKCTSNGGRGTLGSKLQTKTNNKSILHLLPIKVELINSITKGRFGCFFMFFFVPLKGIQPIKRRLIFGEGEAILSHEFFSKISERLA